MIKKLLLETCHDKIFDKLQPYQQKQYNDIIANIETEKTEYIVGVDLASLEFDDKSMICKSRYIDGVFYFDGFMELDDLPSDIKIGEGKIIGGHYYEQSNSR